MKKWEKVLFEIFKFISVGLCGYVMAMGMIMDADNDPHGITILIIGIILFLLVVAMISVINRYK